MRKFLFLMFLCALPSLAAAEKQFAELLAGAEAGERAAMLATGLAYYRGDGVERDCYEARRWLKKGAEAGEVEALYTLGSMDDEGSCGIAQAESAAVFYRRAADMGHAGARYRLGSCIAPGAGLSRMLPRLSNCWTRLPHRETQGRSAPWPGSMPGGAVCR